MIAKLGLVDKMAIVITAKDVDVKGDISFC